MHERRRAIFLDLGICASGLLNGRAAQNNSETLRNVTELERGYPRIVGKFKTRRSGNRFAMAVFKDVLRVRQSSIISLGLVILSLLIAVTFSEAYNSENDNSLKSTVLPSKILKTIIVPDYYPYTFVNDQGKPDGFSVDLANAVAQAMDMKLEISAGTWEHAREALENGTIDFLPMMAASPLRRQSFDFSVPHTIAYDAAFVRRGTQTASSLNDLSGKTVFVMNKDAAHDVISASPSSDTMKLILVDSLPDGLRLLASGEGDAAIMPKLVGLLLVKKLGITNVEASPATIGAYKRPFSFAVKKGDTALMEALNHGLSIVNANGQYRDIYDKWFGVLAPQGLPWELVLKYILGIAVASALVGMVLLVWSLSQRKVVRQQTKSLRESEERFRLLYEYAPLGYQSLDENGHFLEVNPAWLDTLGYSRKEVIGKWFGDFLAPGYQEHFKINFPKFREAGEIHGVEFEMLKKDGSQIAVAFDGKIGRDQQGRFKQTHCILHDISEIKRSQDALRESEEKYRTLFEESFDGLFITSPGGKILDMNKTGVAMFGYDTKEEILSLDLERDVYAHPPDRQRILSMVNEQGTAEDEVVVKKKNGEEMITHCALTAVKDEQGVITSYRGIIRDITDLAQVRLRLENERARLRTLVQTIPDLVWLKDPDGIYLDCNPRFERFFGAKESDIVGKTDYDFVDADLSDFFRDNDRKAMDAGKPGINEEWITFADDGHRELLETIKTPMYDSDGSLIGVLGIGRNITAAREAEEALQAASVYNRSLIEASLDPLVTISAEGKITDVNTATELVTGYSRHELIETDFADYFTDPQRARAGYQRAFTEGVVKDYGLDIRHRDGDLTPVIYNASVYRDRFGEIVGVFAAARDITERKISEELIQIRLNLLEFAASHPLGELLQKTLDEIGSLTHSPIGFYHFVESDQKTLSLQAWSTRTVKEFCKAEGKGQHYSIDRAGVWVDCIRERKPIIHNDYATLPHRKGMPEGHAAVIRELVVPIIKSAQIVAVLGIGNKPTNYTEKDIEVASYFADVTWEIATRKRAQEDLKESEQQYRTLFEESIDGVYSVLRDGTITDANPAFCELFGYMREEMIGKDIRELYLDPADRPRFQKEIEKTSFVKDYEIKFQKRDGAEVDCLISSSVILEEDGRITGYRGIVRDLTARKELHRQLQQAQKMEAVGTLAGGIAHDFNNILQVVSGYSELVLADEDLPDRLRNDLGRVLQAGKSGADLVQRLLTFSRKGEAKPLNLDLNQRIRQTQKFLERTIPRMIDIQVILADDLERVYVDPTQLDQVLMNLAVNARDAMSEGGKLVIETANVLIDEECDKALLGAIPGEYVLLSVSDTGHGMDKETLGHIFEPFYTTKEAGKGTGLGLAMVYGIVHQHGGYITCYSEPGEGTTFKMYFPAIEMEMNLDVATTGIIPAFGTETILLVDDEEFVRDLGKRILERSGYTVLTAANGKEALELYKREREKISLVILDLIMPEMGGKHCLEELLKIDPKARVLIASGFAASGETKEAIETGARGFVGKPYNMKEMLQSVREVLDAT